MIRLKTFLMLNALFFFLSCTGNDWTKDNRNLLYQNCLSNANYEIIEESQVEEICLCTIQKFVDNFSWNEYQLMLSAQISEKTYPEINNRIEIHISSIFKDCNISLFHSSK